MKKMCAGGKKGTFKDLVMILIAILVFVVATILGLHERFVGWARQFGEGLIRIEELTIAFAILAVTFGIFSLRRWKELRAEIAERLRAEEEIIRRNRELSVLYTIDSAASRSLNLEEILQNALDATLKALKVDAGGFYLLKADGETMTMRFQRGFSEEFAQNLRQVRLGEGICGRIPAEKRPVILDVENYSTERLVPFILKEGLKTLVSTPLFVGGEVIGGLSLATRWSRTFPSEEMDLLAAIGQQLGMILQNAGLFEKIQQELSERKRAEEASRIERERLETVTKNMGAGLAIISKDYRTLWANHVLKGMFGDVEDKPCYVTYNQQTDICSGCGVREVFERGSEKVVHEQMGKDINGNMVWSEIVATPIRDQMGNITAALELVIPITERRRAEDTLRKTQEHLRYLGSATPAVLYAAKPLPPYAAIFITDNVKTQLGYESEEFTGDPNFWADHIHPEDAPQIFIRPSDLFEKGYHAHEYRFRHKDGTYQKKKQPSRNIFAGLKKWRRSAAWQEALPMTSTIS